MMERKNGIDHDLSYYIYRLLEEEEILDSKEEEAEWFEETAVKIRRDDEKQEKRDKENQKNGRQINDATTDGGGENYSPVGVKNFYHEPDSPSRAFLMDKLSFYYLLKMCYSWNLSKYLGIPCFFLPAWLVRFGILIPQARVAKGTVDGVCLAIKYGWAINLDGGFTHANKS